MNEMFGLLNRWGLLIVVAGMIMIVIGIGLFTELIVNIIGDEKLVDLVKYASVILAVGLLFWSLGWKLIKR